MDDFYNICRRGDYHEVLNTLEKGENNYELGLRGACSGGNIKIVKLLIKKGANNLYNGLNWACREGHIKIVKLLIKEGANQFGEGMNQACFGGHIKIVKLLIKKGVYEFKHGMTCACSGGQLKIVKLLIKYDINVLDLDAITSALYGGEKSESWTNYIKIIKFIIRKKGMKNISNRYASLYITKLMEIGIPITDLMDIVGCEKIIKDIEEYKKNVLNNLDNHLIKDLANIVTNFCLLKN